MSRVALRSQASMLGLVALSLSLLVSSVVASTLGVDVFICSPTTITFTLLSMGGCPGTITGPGIAGTDCFFQPDENSTGLIPFVSVSLVQIIEVNLKDLPAHVVNYESNYSSGDSIPWSSLSATNITNPSDIPGGIQIIVTGSDENGQTIRNSIAIDYTNDGSVSPIFEIGDQIGWIVISDFSPARPEYCPAVTLQPTTVTPVSPPSDAPVEPKSPAPVMAPSDAPIAPTSTAPVVAPSEAPIAPTSAAPVVAPSEAPEAPTSTAPVEAPSEAPEAPTSTAPVVAPSEAPEAPTSAAPVVAPSDAPEAPSPVLTSVPIAPVELETPSPSEMSMSFDYNWEPEKPDKKGGKKGVAKDAMLSKSKDGKGKEPKPSTKGSKDKSPKVERKNEKEGAKEKGDDDNEGSNKRLRRAAELQFFIV